MRYFGKIQDAKDLITKEYADNADAGKQTKITASGVLIGDGNGGVTAKTVDSTPTADSTNLVTSGGVKSAIDSQAEKIESSLAIIVDGDTCSTPVPVGGYAYIKNNAHGLAEGLYKNTSSSAFPVSGGTANSSVFTVYSDGGLNEIQRSKPNIEQITVPARGSAVLPVATGVSKNGIAFSSSSDAAKMGVWAICLTSANIMQVKEMLSSSILTATKTSRVGITFSNSSASTILVTFFWG